MDNDSRSNLSSVHMFEQNKLSNFETSLSKTTFNDKSSQSKSLERKLPQWLISFNSNKSQTSEAQSRPLTENTLSSQRPIWFQDLLNQRRNSEELIASKQNDSSWLHLSPINKRSNTSLTDVKFNSTIEHKITSLYHGSDTFFTSSKLNGNCDTNKELINVSKPHFDDYYFGNTKSERESKKKPDLKDSEEGGPDVDDCDFIIPNLPQGKHLLIEIKSNWGDEQFIGLNGIEIFEYKTKNLAQINKIWCECYQKDGKQDNSRQAGDNEDVYKLIDNVYRSHDNCHIWSKAWNGIDSIKIGIEFAESLQIVLLRIWNYNKSRIYSYRGIRFVVITLDEKVIFKGEIAKACGELTGPLERFGDTILFTTDDMILESVAHNDLTFHELLSSNTL